MTVGLISNQETVVAQREDVKTFNDTDEFLASPFLSFVDCIVVDARCNGYTMIKELIARLYQDGFSKPLLFLVKGRGANSSLSGAAVLPEGEEDTLDDKLVVLRSQFSLNDAVTRMAFAMLLNTAIER